MWKIAKLHWKGDKFYVSDDHKHFQFVLAYLLFFFFLSCCQFLLDQNNNYRTTLRFFFPPISFMTCMLHSCRCSPKFIFKSQVILRLCSFDSDQPQIIITHYFKGYLNVSSALLMSSNFLVKKSQCTLDRSKVRLQTAPHVSHNATSVEDTMKLNIWGKSINK